MVRRDRSGFGLVAALVVTVAMVVIAATAVVPNLAQVRDQWRVERTHDRLTRLTDGGTALLRFQNDVGTYPATLSQLSREITNADPTLCGDTYSGGETGGWSGRYAGRIHASGGTPLPMGLALDTLEYDTSEATDALVVVLTGVREEQARHLDRKTDGAADGASGRVRYGTADAEGLLTLRWRTPITTC